MSGLVPRCLSLGEMVVQHFYPEVTRSKFWRGSSGLAELRELGKHGKLLQQRLERRWTSSMRVSAVVEEGSIVRTGGLQVKYDWPCLWAWSCFAASIQLVLIEDQEFLSLFCLESVELVGVVPCPTFQRHSPRHRLFGRPTGLRHGLVFAGRELF